AAVFFLPLLSFCQERSIETADSAPIEILSHPSFERQDSLTWFANQLSDSLSQVTEIANRKINSLNNKMANKYTSRVDSLRARIFSSLDSLKFPVNKDSIAANTFGEIKSKITERTNGDSVMLNKSRLSKSKDSLPVPLVSVMERPDLTGLGIPSGTLEIPTSPGLDLPNPDVLEDTAPVSVAMSDISEVSEIIQQVDIGNIPEGYAIPVLRKGQLPDVPLPDVNGINNLNIGENAEQI